MDKLLPCPFCGGEADIEEIPGSPFTNETYMWAVGCKDCNIGWYKETKAEAIAAWNSRAGKDINVATNADRIRGATDEKLANVISAALGKMSYDCYRCPAEDFCHSGECEQAWLDWLKQPVKEE